MSSTCHFIMPILSVFWEIVQSSDYELWEFLDKAVSTEEGGLDGFDFKVHGSALRPESTGYYKRFDSFFFQLSCLNMS